MSKKLLFNNSSGGGTEQEGDWVEANMRLGWWNSIDAFQAGEFEYMGYYQHSAEVIYLDGLKEIHVQGVNYIESVGIGIIVFEPDGSTPGAISISEVVNTGTDVVTVTKLREVLANNYGVPSVIAISFTIYADKNAGALRYKLIR